MIKERFKAWRQFARPVMIAADLLILGVMLYGAITFQMPAWWLVLGWQVRALWNELRAGPRERRYVYLVKELQTAANVMGQLLDKWSEVVQERNAEIAKLERTIADMNTVHRAQLTAIAVREQVGMRPVVPDALREFLKSENEKNTPGWKIPKDVKVYETTGEPS